MNNTPICPEAPIIRRHYSVLPNVVQPIVPNAPIIRRHYSAFHRVARRQLPFKKRCPRTPQKPNGGFKSRLTSHHQLFRMRSDFYEYRREINEEAINEEVENIDMLDDEDTDRVAVLFLQMLESA